MTNFDPVSYLMGQKAAGGGGGGSSTLAGLTDVDISNPTNGQTLVYNATSGKWENGAGGGGVLVCTADPATRALNHTWQEIKDAPLAVWKASDSPVEDVVSYACSFKIDNGDYLVTFVGIIEGPTNPIMFLTAIASSANDYPVVQMNP